MQSSEVLQSVESQEKDKTRRSQNPPPADERAKTVRGDSGVEFANCVELFQSHYIIALNIMLK